MLALYVGFLFLLFWGLGHRLRALAFSLGTEGAWLSLALGISAFLFLGSLLSALTLVKPIALVLCLLGLLAIFPWKEFLRQLRSAALKEVAIPAAALLLLLAIFSVFLAPSKVFNFHDDLHCYFVHPQRMLLEGSLFGSPLDASGVVGFGGMAFLQTFTLLLFPPESIDAVDSLGGLILLALLWLSVLRKAPLAVQIFGALSLFLIPSQKVNSSCLYLGAALLGASYLYLVSAAEKASPWILGLLFAALLSLKTTFAPFLILPALFQSYIAFKADRLFALKVAGASLLFFLPWIFPFLPYLFSKPEFTSLFGQGAVSYFSLLETSEMFWGGKPLGFLLLLLSLVALLKLRPRIPLSGALCILALVISQLLFLYVIGPLFWDGESSFRYTLPLFLGPLPLLLCFLWRQSFSSLATKASMALAALALLCFIPSATIRFSIIFRFHNEIAFSDANSPRYQDFMNSLPAEKALLRAMQTKMPAGECVLAWVGAPYLLDFERNQIQVANENGVTATWAHFPACANFLIERAGPAVSTRALFLQNLQDPIVSKANAFTYARGLDFFKILLEKVNGGAVVFEDERFLLIRL